MVTRFLSEFLFSVHVSKEKLMLVSLLLVCTPFLGRLLTWCTYASGCMTFYSVTAGVGLAKLEQKEEDFSLLLFERTSSTIRPVMTGFASSFLIVSLWSSVLLCQARYWVLGNCFNLPPHLHLPRMEMIGLESRTLMNTTDWNNTDCSSALKDWKVKQMWEHI